LSTPENVVENDDGNDDGNDDASERLTGREKASARERERERETERERERVGCRARRRSFERRRLRSIPPSFDPLPTIQNTHERILLVSRDLLLRLFPSLFKEHQPTQSRAHKTSIGRE